MPPKHEITIQKAAAILGMRHGLLLDIIDQGDIPVRGTSARRTLLLSDVMAFRKERNRNRRTALNQLADAVEAAGLYEATYTGDVSSVER